MFVKPGGAIHPSTVAEGFLAYALAKKKTGTARGYNNALRLHILPQLGTKRLTKITHADVESLHASMSERRPQRYLHECVLCFV